VAVCVARTDNEPYVPDPVNPTGIFVRTTRTPTPEDLKRIEGFFAAMEALVAATMAGRRQEPQPLKEQILRYQKHCLHYYNNYYRQLYEQRVEALDKREKKQQQQSSANTSNNHWSEREVEEGDVEEELDVRDEQILEAAGVAWMFKDEGHQQAQNNDGSSGLFHSDGDSTFASTFGGAKGSPGAQW
jgi:hypothetical protein